MTALAACTIEASGFARAALAGPRLATERRLTAGGVRHRRG